MPTAVQVEAALAVLSTVPEADRSRFLAVVALVQPGKQYGLWSVGQEVVPLPGVWLGENVTGDSICPLSEARAAAEEAGERWLEARDLDGTTGYVMVGPDGHAAVFEGFGARRSTV